MAFRIVDTGVFSIVGNLLFYVIRDQGTECAKDYGVFCPCLMKLV